MTEVLARRQWLMLAYLGLLTLAVAAQAVAWQVVHARYGRRLIHGGLRRGFEAMVLVFLLSQGVVLGQRLHYLSDSVFGPAPDTLRWLGWVLLMATAVIAQTRRREPERLLVAGVAALALPVVDLLPAPWSGLALFAVPSYLGVRAVVLAVAHFRELRTGISALSVQEAIDRLPSGLMFIRPDASVVLINSQMRTVMAGLTGRVHRHSAEFLTAVETGPTSDTDEPDAPVFKLGDGRHWMLSRSPLVINGEAIEQVVATDVTLRWQMVTELRDKHAQLEASAWQLQAEIDGLWDACTADELLWARTRVHDVIGQRASALLRLVKGGTQPDRQQLVEIVGDLHAELDAREPRRTAAEELRMLATVLDGIGVRLVGPARLPADEAAAMAVADIIREAASNAIKHASATEIVAESQSDADEYVLRICDNGYAGAPMIIEGGGLKGMRYRLAALNGTLRVEAGPSFELVATIPGAWS